MDRPPRLDGANSDPFDPSSLAVIGGDVSCRNCSHKEVCKYLAVLQERIESEEDAVGWPFDAHEVAAICDAYDPVDDDDDDDGVLAEVEP